MAQYSLEASAYPIGISEYQLSQLMPEELKSQLPAIEEIEASLTNLQSEEGFPSEITLQKLFSER